MEASSKSAIFKEYKIQILHGLQPRTKWKIEVYNIKKVILRSMWFLGIIAEVFSGKNGFARNANVKREWKNVEKTNHKELACFQ